jgi:hypothetical protein
MFLLTVELDVDEIEAVAIARGLSRQFVTRVTVAEDDGDADQRHVTVVEPTGKRA